MKQRIFLVIVIFLGGVFSVFAQTKKIEKLQKQRKALQVEIENTNRLFIDMRKQTSTILQRMQLIENQINARKAMISVNEKHIAALDNQQKELQKEIDALTEELNEKKEKYARAIKSVINKKLTKNKLFFILSGKSLGESLRRMQYLKQYSQWQKSKAEEIKTKNAVLEVKKKTLQKAKAAKKAILVSLQNQQNSLLNEEKKRKIEITNAKGKQNELKKILQDKQKKANKLNAQIERLIAREVARQEREARRKAEEAERKRQAELAAQERSKAQEKETKSSSKTSEVASKKHSSKATSRKRNDVRVASAETFNLSSNFAANRGRLPMPVTGAASIVSGFGKQKHSEWNVTTNSAGVDIQARPGADIRSVFEGEVTSVVAFPGYNNCVIVRHGDYYTFYGNIVNLYVKQGEKVKTGQPLGKIFSDSSSTTMHFQLWRKTTKLNPEPWLK